MPVGVKKFPIVIIRVACRMYIFLFHRIHAYGPPLPHLYVFVSEKKKNSVDIRSLIFLYFGNKNTVTALSSVCFKQQNKMLPLLRSMCSDLITPKRKTIGSIFQAPAVAKTRLQLFGAGVRLQNVNVFGMRAVKTRTICNMAEFECL